MRLFSFNTFILVYSFLLIGSAEAQGSAISRSSELDSLKSIRLKSPQRAIRYARQVLNDLNPEQIELESKSSNILGEI